MKKKILATISVFALISAAIAALVLNACSGGGSSSSGVISAGTMTVLNPTVTGPIAAPDRPAPGALTGNPSRNYNFLASQFDLAAKGYVEEEYFISGTATRFANTTGLTTATIIDDGHPYKTRIVVRKPSDPTKFSGNVIMEWYNVTNNMDMEYCWYELYDYFMRRGDIWIGVSAQRVGVNALVSWSTPTTAVTSPPSSPTATDRYATLDVSHLKDGTAVTTDTFHLDIFSQAAQAIRHPVGVNPLAGYTVQKIIGMGQSQSARMMSSYVNNVDPLAKVFDGFVLESSLGNAIRTDLRVPVWKVLTETDVISYEGNIRRPDDSKFVTWEVAGTSHNDGRALDSRVLLEHRDWDGYALEDSLVCSYMPPGSRIPFYQVLSAGLDQFKTWIRGGAQLVSAPPITIIQFTPTVIPARDLYGNALGGIRLSQQAVPTGTNSGINAGNGACARWGYTLPFVDTTLNDIYTTHTTYVNLVTTATNSALNSKYITAEDSAQNIADATAAVIPPNGH